MGFSLRSSDEERRRLRIHVSQLERANEAHKSARTRLESENKQLQQEISLLKKENTSLEEGKEALQSRCEELEDQCRTYREMVFKKNRRSDQTKGAADSETQAINALVDTIKDKKKRGRKKGHKGVSRKLPEKADEHKHVFLERCSVCGKSLARSTHTKSHTVEDLPPLNTTQTIVTHYEIEEQWCGGCKQHMRAQPVDVIKGSRFGVHVFLFVMLQRFGAKSSFPSIAKLLHDFFGMHVSHGTLVQLLHRARTQFGQVYEHIRLSIAQSQVKHADETSWRIDGMNAWVWGLFTEDQAYYVIDESRGKKVAQDLLSGSDPGDVLVRDDYAAYTKLNIHHQSCWAHLLRKSHQLCERTGVSDEMKSLHEELKQFYTHLKAGCLFNDDTLRESLHEKLKEQLHTIIQRNYTHAQDARTLQTRLRNQSNKLITALLHPGTPLTNNLAEQGLRPLVVARKMSGGSRSEKGAKTHAQLMSVYETFNRQKKPLAQTLKNLLLNKPIS